MKIVKCKRKPVKGDFIIWPQGGFKDCCEVLWISECGDNPEVEMLTPDGKVYKFFWDTHDGFRKLVKIDE